MSAFLTRSTTRGTTAVSYLALTGGLGVLVGLFWPECRAAVSVWIASTAYGHCFLVAPISAYLIWERRESLRGLVPQITPAYALLGLPLPLAWLAAERLGIMEGRQLVMLATAEVLFLTVLGWRLYRALMGPLLYLVFLVPFGAFITPLLQTFTAHFIDIGLNVLGVPHYVTDMTIEIGAGTFYVAEACAGLRFLIASIAFGVFFALLNYNSTGRRVAFMLASIAIPVVANGFRALGIVVLGGILGSAEAAAADHIIYGWVFFSFVMLLLVAAGLPFREPLPQAQPQPPAPPLHAPAWAVAVVLAIAALGPATALALDTRVAPAQLAAAPRFVAPAGCTLRTAEDGMPDQAGFAMDCGARRWSITVRAMPARSTAAAVNDARTRLIGPLDGDEVVTGPLSGAPGWTSIVSHVPTQVTGLSTWVDGRLATGGVAQRLLQARQSMTGGDYQPAVIAVTARPPGLATETELHALVADLGQFVAAQPDLGAQMARVTATSSPPPRP